jgi:hypothetical protein
MFKYDDENGHATKLIGYNKNNEVVLEKNLTKQININLF